MKTSKFVVEFDLDGVLCVEPKKVDGTHSYIACEPITENIELCNRLFDKCYIRINTSRFLIDGEATIHWLAKNGVKYDDLRLEKPQADIRIDDRAFNGSDRNEIIRAVNEKLSLDN